MTPFATQYQLLKVYYDGQVCLLKQKYDVLHHSFN